MPFVAVPDTIGINVRGTFQTVPVENTFYANYVTPPDEAALEALVELLWDQVVADWLPIMSTAFTLSEVYARDLAVEIAAQASFSASPADGEVTGDTLPNLNTIAVKRASGLTGRSARGRIFWMGLSESQVDNNIVKIAHAGAIVVALNNFNTVCSAEGFTPVIVSRYHNGAARVTPLTFPFSSWAVTDLQVDRRSSRMPE